MRGTTARAVLSTVRAFRSRRKSQSLALVSCTGEPMRKPPAMLQRTSTRPTPSTALAMLEASRRSTTGRSHDTTFAPRAANAAATARPRFPAPPVTTTFSLAIRHHLSGSFAEAEAGAALALATAAQHELVAVLDEGAALAVRQAQRIAAAGGELEQRAERVARLAGNRPAAEQVAGAQVAAVRSVMRDELRRRPVRARIVAAREPRRRSLRGAHLCAAQIHLELDRQHALALVRFRGEVGQ